MIGIARCIARSEKHERDEPMKTTMHTVDLRYTKEDLLLLFDMATKRTWTIEGVMNAGGGSLRLVPSLDQCRDTLRLDEHRGLLCQLA